ncbi:hypothetical protein VQ042_03640 [Aurantimonas sp. A2-1-M11]|uniref:hypothetical protein n=1 Tax=Aurantimonas sp. A2-1-M11 TaxID=3113712 RepID=UPI002F937BA5
MIGADVQAWLAPEHGTIRGPVVRFSDLSLVLQIVAGLASLWVSFAFVAVCVINIVEVRRRPTALPRAVRTILSLAPIWLLAQGYIAALAKWFTIRNEISLVAIGELVLALTPGVNVFYGWNWLVDILWFNGKLLAAIFGGSFG